MLIKLSDDMYVDTSKITHVGVHVRNIFSHHDSEELKKYYDIYVGTVNKEDPIIMYEICKTQEEANKKLENLIKKINSIGEW